MPIYSHSRIACFEQCPLKYKYEYVDQLEIEEKESIEAFLGSRVHEALQKLYQDVKFAKIPTLDEIIAYYNEMWKKNWNDNIHITRSEYTEENYRKMGETYIERYYKKHHPFNEGIIIDLERKILIDLNPEGTYKLLGVIDRIMKVDDGVYEIHDYKTSSYLPPQKQFEKDRQLALYSIGLQQMFPDIKKINLVWHYVAFGEEIRSSRTEEQLSKLKEEVNATIQKIELATKLGIFPPKESNICPWCSYASLCPLQAHLYKVSEMKPEEYLKEDGVQLVNKYAELAQKKNELKKEMELVEEEMQKVGEALFDYAKKNNFEVVVGSDVKAKLKVYQKIRFPLKNTEERKELERIIKEAGKWEEVSSLDQWSLARIVEKKQWPQEILKKIENFQTTEEQKRIFLSKLEEANN